MPGAEDLLRRAQLRFGILPLFFVLAELEQKVLMYIRDDSPCQAPKTCFAGLSCASASCLSFLFSQSSNKKALTHAHQGQILTAFEFGEPGEIRTLDHYIKSVMLYQLSYWPIQIIERNDIKKQKRA